MQQREETRSPRADMRSFTVRDFCQGKCRFTETRQLGQYINKINNVSGGKEEAGKCCVCSLIDAIHSA